MPARSPTLLPSPPAQGPPQAILALDTSTRTLLTALGLADGSIFSVEGPTGPGPQHGRLVVPSLRETIEKASISRDQLALLAVGLGPGSFTGLRIGLTAMKGLALAWNLPLVGLSSFDVLAWSLPEPPAAFRVAIDAQRGDCQLAAFELSAETRRPVRHGPIQLVRWADLVSKPGPSVFSPDADRILRPPDLPLSCPAVLVRPTPEALLDLARLAWREQRFLDPWFSEPDYLRRSAAEDQREALGSARQAKT